MNLMKETITEKFDSDGSLIERVTERVYENKMFYPQYPYITYTASADLQTMNTNDPLYK